jgi:serine protease Do
MKVRPVKVMSIGLGMVIGGAAWFGLTNTTFGKTVRPKPPKLTVENGPISREVKLATSFAPVVKKVAPAVVTITSAKVSEARIETRDPFGGRNPFFRFFDPPRQPSQPEPESGEPSMVGSGVIISSDGFILTNNHVIEGADNIEVTLNGQVSRVPAEVLGADPHTDIAVLKIESEAPLPFVTLTDSDNLEVGDVVLGVGNPFGVGQTVTMGIVSAKGRSGFGKVDIGDFIQTDAAINPGNSGGPLVDAEGRLVGINTMILSRSGGNNGLGFAVPINMARGVMDQIVEFGDVRRGLLGILMQRMDETLAQQFGVEVDGGVLVGDVTPGGPADEAGIRAGDVIMAFDDEPVGALRDLKLKVAQTRPDTDVDIVVLRDGDRETIPVTIGEIPEKGYAAVTPGRVREQGQMGHDALDGVTVTDLTPAARSQLGAPRTLTGVLVTDVERRSAAYVAGLRSGYVIRSIEQQPVGSADEAVELSERITKRVVLLRVWSQTTGSRFMPVDAAKDRR